MKKKVLFALGFTAASLVCITPYLKSNVNGAQGKLTSAPGELNCLSAGCHTGNTVNAVGGTLAMKLLDNGNEVNEWVAGKTYNVNVTISKPSAVKYGFQISAKKGTTTTNFGTFTVGTGTRVALGTTNYITHNNAAATGDWTFTWTAPASGSDPVTFYLAGNAANGDNTEGGDFIYTTSRAINASSASIDPRELFASNTRILQNPVDRHLIVDFVQPVSANASIKVYTLDGQEIKLPFLLDGNGDNKRFVVETSALRQGMYVFSVQSGDYQTSKTFLKE
jgi:hypothetical protein